MDGHCRGKTVTSEAVFQGIKSDSKVIFITHTIMTVKNDMVDNIKVDL